MRAWIITVALVAAPALASAEPSGQPKPDEGIESLLKRLDDVERARRDPETQAPAVPTAPATTAPVVAEAAVSDAMSVALWGVGMAALIFGVAFTVARWRPRSGVDIDTQSMALQESMWIGRGQRVLLVRVKDQDVLLGVSGGQISGLAVFEPPERRAVRPRATPDIIDDRPRKPAEKPTAAQFASMVEEELSQSTRPPRLDKQQILQRLNSL